MRRVPFIVTLIILFSGRGTLAATQAYLGGTEIVIDLKKVEIPNLKEMIESAESGRSNEYFLLEIEKKISLNGQKIKTYRLMVRPWFQRIQFSLPWLVSVNASAEAIEVNGPAVVDKKVVRVDLILDN